MKRISLFAGLVLLLVFVVSGQYMKYVMRPEHLNNLSLRMEVRANHIYILFVALLNILSARCELNQLKNVASWRWLDPAFRMMLLAAGVAAVYGFLYEHDGDLTERRGTFLTAVLSLTAVGLFLLHEGMATRQVK